ncbi:MAG: WecB/TagA/CpsF family glycosyltransferase [Actinomycetota bacterium]
MDSLKRATAEFLRCGRSHVVHFLSADPIARARGDEAYRDLLNRADLNAPDGMPVAWAVRLLGQESERVAGSEGIAALSAWGVESGLRHYLFGGRPEVLQRLRSHLEGSNPRISIVGAESPPFRRLSRKELREAADRIREAQADLLWIGLGTPSQDWVAEELRIETAAPVILCVGAAFDFVSGAKRRAPRWMQRFGLEWIYRLVHEPRRLWRRYLVGNPIFLLGVMSAYRRNRRSA